MKSYSGVVITALLAVAASVYVAWGAPDAYPMDDAYIHFAYADNLAAGVGLVFQSPGETSVGSTSILWVLLLALGARLGVPAVTLARVLGVLAHAAAAALTAALVEPAGTRWRAKWLPIAAGGLVAVCGPLVWFSLSGMETMLFVALGLASLLAYRAGRQVALGVCLGLLCLTRPEGLALGLGIAAAEAVRTRRLPLHLWRAGAIAAGLILPWFGYLYFRTGEFLPGSYYGKQFTQAAAIEFFASRAAWIQALARLRPVVFAALSAGFWFLYYWGGVYLPGPRLEPSLALEAPSLSPLAVPVALLWLALAARGPWHLWREKAEPGGLERSAWLAMGVWLLLHNAAFGLLLPAPGTASRYIAVDYVLLAGGAALGLASLARWRAQAPAATRPAFWWWAAAAVVAGVAASTLNFWREVYDSSARQVAEVRIPMAQEIAEAAPRQAVVAAFDIGVVAYYTPQPMADLGGLTDTRVLEFAQARAIDEYLCAVQAEYLVAPDSNRAGGGSYYDYLGSLGLNADPDLKLVELERMAMDVAEWRVGGAATGNSTAAVLLYRVDQTCGP